MTEIKKQLELRKTLKMKKPAFVREDSHKRKEVSPSWRRPKGKHSKLGQKHAGHQAMVDAGYKGPRETRGLHRSGLKQVLVHNIKELEKMNNEKEGIIFAHGLGIRKKTQLLKKAIEKKIKVLSLKNPEEYIKQTEERFKQKKKDKKTEVKTEETKTTNGQVETEKMTTNDKNVPFGQETKKTIETKNETTKKIGK